jgi:uncharacterized protein (DUF58 family)
VSSPTTSGAGEVGAYTYEMRGYRLLMFGSLAGITLIFGTLAVLAIRGASFGVALFLIGIYAFLVITGLRAQQRTAVRLTVSPAGLDVTWILGRHFTPWRRARRIRFLHPRWDPNRVQLIDIDVEDDRPLQLFDRLSQ